MGFIESIQHCFRNYAVFRGRSPRSEYWNWTLFYVLIQVPIVLISMEPSLVFLAPLIQFGMLLPSFAVITRRLHDLDRSGWSFLVAVIPLVGYILLFYWFCQRGTRGENRFGSDPLAATD